MTDTPRWWRADGGYQDVSDERQTTPAFTPHQGQPNMCFFTGFGQIYYPGYGAGFAPWMMPQGNYVEGPIGLAGLCSPPPPYAPLGQAPLACAPSPPAAPEAEKKEESKKAEKKENPWAPPKIPDGANYMFDSENTMLHIFKKAAPIWTEKYRTQELGFKMFKVSVNFTFKMVIENTLKKSGDDCKGWVATEAVESGDGHWVKGTTIEYDSDKGKGTLKSMGWSSKRGDSLPPVWLVVHKIDFK